MAERDDAPKRHPLTNWLLLAVLGWMAWSWVLSPAHHLSQSPTLPSATSKNPLPPDALLPFILHHLEASRSPFFRAIARRRLTVAVSKYVTPSHIERTFRGLLLKSSLGKWKSSFEQWDHCLATLEKKLPKLRLHAYRAYLYLQAGELQRLLPWARKMPDKTPTHRLDTLLYIWLGHGAFWSGHSGLAMGLYLRAEEAFKAAPEWQERTTTNWRLPAEYSTLLFHKGLLYRLQNRPAAAYRSFLQMATRWIKLRKKASRSSDIYAARLLAAHSAWHAGMKKEARQRLQEAATFAKDPTLAHLLQARFAAASKAPKRRAQGLAQWAKLQKKMRLHYHSYADSQAIAGLHRALHLMKHRQAAKGLEVLRGVLKLVRSRAYPPTLQMLAARNTFPMRFLPVSPKLYHRLLQALPQRLPTPPKARATPKPASRAQPASKPSASRATSRPAARAASRPTTQPSQRSKSALKPSAREAKPAKTPKPTPPKPQKKPKKPPKSLAFLRAELTWLQGLSHLKWSDWERGAALFRGLRKGPIKAIAADAELILGMLAFQRRQMKQAIAHLERFHKAAPEQSLGRIYLAYALRKKQPKRALALLRPLRGSKAWKRALERLQPGPKLHKKWIKFRKQSGFWWRLLGARGFLSKFDPFLSQKALYWHHRAQFFKDPATHGVFRALRTSHLLGRFGFLTLLTKQRMWTLLEPKHANKHLKQWRFLRKIYDQWGDLEYVLDRSLYGHRWGLIALGFF